MRLRPLVFGAGSAPFQYLRAVHPWRIGHGRVLRIEGNRDRLVIDDRVFEERSAAILPDFAALSGQLLLSLQEGRSSRFFSFNQRLNASLHPASASPDYPLPGSVFDGITSDRHSPSELYQDEFRRQQ